MLLLTNRETNERTNNTEFKFHAGFEPRTPGRMANPIITELNRILARAVVRNQDEAMHKEVVSRSILHRENSGKHD